MLNDFAVLHFENIDGNQWLGPPAYIAAVNHYQITFRDDHAELVGQVLVQARNEVGDRLRTVRDDWIVLHIVRGEVPINDGNVTLDERALEHIQHDLFVALGLHVDLHDLSHVATHDLAARAERHSARPG